MSQEHYTDDAGPRWTIEAAELVVATTKREELNCTLHEQALLPGGPATVYGQVHTGHVGRRRGRQKRDHCPNFRRSRQPQHWNRRDRVGFYFVTAGAPAR